MSDDYLGMKGYLSQRLRRLVCLAASDLSFEKASEHLLEFSGLKVCAETLRHSCHQESRKMQSWLRQAPVVAEMFAEEPGLAEVQMDAGKVNTKQGWRDLKVASFARRDKAQPQGPKDWNSRTLPAAKAQVLLAAMETSDQFTHKLEKEVIRFGLDQEDVHCLADGAEWIWNSIAQLFHQPKETLDVYHGLEHLSAACKLSYGDGTELAKSEYERAQALLLWQGSQGIEKFLKEQREKKPDSESILADVERYFTRHKDRIDYPGNLKEGLPIGSGLIEGNIKTLGMRLKARGARWQADNVPRMAHLCGLRHSTYWPDYWASSV